MIKRLSTEKDRLNLKKSKKYKGSDFSKLTRKELDELIVLLAQRAGIL